MGTEAPALRAVETRPAGKRSTLTARIRILTAADPRQLTPAQRAVAGVALSSILVSFLLSISLGAFGSVIVLSLVVLTGVVPVRLVRHAVPSEDRGPLAALVVLAFAIRCALAATFYAWSAAAGHEGFIVSDDREYASAAWHLVQFARGLPEQPYVPPYWSGQAYLMGPYVYVEAAMFALIGKQVLAMLFVNAALSTATMVLLADSTRRLFGRSAAIVVAAAFAFFPSLMFWSILNLKDTLLLFVITLLFWSFHRFAGSRAWVVASGLSALALVLLLVHDLRLYVFMELALIAPVAMAVRRGSSAAVRVRGTLLAAAASAAVIGYTGVWTYFVQPMNTLAALETVRGTMSVGRTAFVETLASSPGASPPPTVAVSPAVGTAEVAAVSGPMASPSPADARAQASDLLTPQAGRSAAPGPPLPATLLMAVLLDGAAVVLSIVALISGIGLVTEKRENWMDGSPHATILWRRRAAAIVAIVVAAAVVVGSGWSHAGDDILAHTIGFLPTGLAHAVFAPFPWAASSDADKATFSDMMLWYALLFAAAWTIWHWRGPLSLALPELLFVASTLMVLAVAEGNVGTLYRHRATVIPFVAMLAAPSLVLAVQAMAHLPRAIVAAASTQGSARTG